MTNCKFIMQQSSIEIRSYRPEDYSGLVRVLGRCGLLDLDHPEQNAPDTYAGLVAGWPDRIQVAHTVGAGIVGCIMAPHDQYHGPMISSFGVDPEYRELGIGGRLVGRMLDALRENGHNSVELLMRTGNERLRRFYEKRGFSVIDTCLLMQQDLPAADTALAGKHEVSTANQGPGRAFDIIYNLPAISSTEPMLFGDLLATKLHLPAIGDEEMVTPEIVLERLDEYSVKSFWCRLRFKAGKPYKYKIIRTVSFDQPRFTRSDREFLMRRGFYISKGPEGDLTTVQLFRGIRPPQDGIRETVYADLIDDAAAAAGRQAVALTLRREL